MGRSRDWSGSGAKAVANTGRCPGRPTTPPSRSTTSPQGNTTARPSPATYASVAFCNSFKGSDLTSLDRQTRRITPLFHPRRHKWAKHFRWDGPYLIGRTAIGRVTVALLHINDEYRVELREALIAEGVFPS
jgi:hypothetical protein